MQRIFTQDWWNYFWIAVACFVLPSIPQGKQSESTWSICEISINVNKLFTCLSLFLDWYCCCLLTSLSPFLLLYFCLFVDHVNQPLSFFGALGYHFNNTISSFVTILTSFYALTKFSILSPLNVINWFTLKQLFIGSFGASRNGKMLPNLIKKSSFRMKLIFIFVGR